MRLVYAFITLFLLLMTSTQCQQTAEDRWDIGTALKALYRNADAEKAFANVRSGI